MTEPSPRWTRRELLALGLGSALAPTARAADERPGTGPWDLKSLRRVPPHQVVASEEVREGDTIVRLSSLYYEGESWMGKPTRVFAYYARPADLPEELGKRKRLPAMLLVHGGGGTAFPEWARLWAARGYAALAMDLAGCGPGRKRLEDGGPDQGDEWKFRRLKDGVKNAWSYQAIASVLRGASLLRSMPEVERERLGITGISWGGYLTSIAMSLDDRFRVAIPVYGCGYLHENSAWVPTLAQLPAEERQTWIENFDPSRYLPRCKTPVLWMNGTNDFAYPLDSYRKSYRAVRGPRFLCVTVKMPHGHPQGWARPEIAMFAESVLLRERREPGLAVVSVPSVRLDMVKVAYDSPSAVERAQLHWTADTALPWQQREWTTTAASVVGLNEIEATLPARRPLVFFLTVTDVRGAVTSSEHLELPAGA